MIDARDLGKQYSVESRQHPTRLTEALIQGIRGFGRGGGSSSFWALRHATFTVAAGETLGLIGRNGAGKSTLLKVLSRITVPTVGSLRMRGRVGSLLEVGTGFHPELSGRENILLNGAILGMKEREIVRQMDEIIEFSGVARFIDMPVKRYSSGMFVRLAFSVAAHLRTEILLVDEVLAVGDAEFRERCLGKMGDVTAEEGRSIVFVSHDLGAVRDLCDRCLLIHQGEIEIDSTPDVAISGYIAGTERAIQGELPAQPDDAVAIERVALRSPANVEALTTSDELFVDVTYTVRRSVRGVNLVATLRRNGMPLFTTYDTDTDDTLSRRETGRFRATWQVPVGLLKAGRYSLNVGAEFTNVEAIVNHLDVVGFQLHEARADAAQRGYYEPRSGHLALEIPWDTDRVSV